MVQFHILPFYLLCTDQCEHAEGGNGGGGIGDQIIRGGLYRQTAVTAVDADHEYNQQVANVGDGRIGQHALDVGLQQGQQVTRQHTQDCQQAGDLHQDAIAEQVCFKE